ncbi:MAG: tetratricopeptide repeat protein [Planctomycetes bacterium]|nr:tetratricopeptide repeat protein [Planctomycetota bacterium]
MSDPLRPEDDLVPPDVMFLPLAAAPDEVWQRIGMVDGVDPGLLSRRLPDFVHQVINQGEGGPTAMLELQTDYDEGPVRWMRFAEVPERDELFELVPAGLDVRAVVTGEVAPVENGIRVEFCVFRNEPGDEWVSQRVAGTLPLQDPVPGLLRMARHLARALELRFVEPASGLLTSSGRAFLHFLEGLDNAMLLSGDLDIAVPDDREQLIRPFAEALTLDPAFGLALRVANATTTLAVHGQRLDQETARRFLDRCFAAQPGDGEACVAVAEQLSGMGDDRRAQEWLEHATLLDPPPARGLENLGILKARDGDLSAARRLWQRGLEIDGHPDFFSHLAQLCFAEQREDDAWQFIVRGLWRLRERTLRAAEWDDRDRNKVVLLECLHAVMVTRTAPEAVAGALDELRDLFSAEDRVNLGLCLYAAGRVAAARDELAGGLRAVALDLDARDRAVRTLLNIAVPGFEQRFAKACDTAQRARDPRPALEEFAAWYELQDEFWPALYFGGVARRRLGDSNGALDLFAEALELSPGQADVLYEMAELFASRQNCKHALELLDEALLERPREVRYHAARLRYLHALGRRDEALQWLDRIVAEGVCGDELQRAAKLLRRPR